MSKRSIAEVATVLVFLLTGFLGGRLTTDPAQAAESPEPASFETAPVPIQPPIRIVQHDSSAEATAITAPTVEPRPKGPVATHAHLQDSEACDEPQESVSETMTRRAQEDPHVLSATLERLRVVRDRQELELLAAALGRVADPEVERVALEIVRRDTDLGRRLAALQILDALDTPAARTVALEVLANDSDRLLRRAAVYALPDPTGISAHQAQAVSTALTGVLGADRDPELRRRAAVALGRWAPSLNEVVRALEEDPSPDVRAGCAYACELAGRRDAKVVAALVRTLQTSEEDPLVRENAWKALGALGPLSGPAHAAWSAFASEREAEAEGH